MLLHRKPWALLAFAAQAMQPTSVHGDMDCTQYAAGTKTGTLDWVAGDYTDTFTLITDTCAHEFIPTTPCTRLAESHLDGLAPVVYLVGGVS